MRRTSSITLTCSTRQCQVFPSVCHLTSRFRRCCNQSQKKKAGDWSGFKEAACRLFGVQATHLHTSSQTPLCYQVKCFPVPPSMVFMISSIYTSKGFPVSVTSCSSLTIHMYASLCPQPCSWNPCVPQSAPVILSTPTCIQFSITTIICLCIGVQ